ncbi:MAG: acyl-CoA dehydrogenase family protein, partial [Pseudonocardiaceae bacterium]
MTPTFTSAQNQLRQGVRALLAQQDSLAELGELAGGAGPNRPEDHPWRLWRQLGARGWLAPHWPVRYGGLGLTWVEAGIVAEELALHGVPDTAIVNGIYNVGEFLRVTGTPRQRQRYLPQIASGRMMATALLTEPGSGSDLASLSCAATPHARGWVLTGTKVWNAKAHLAEVAICAARTCAGTGYAGISLFLVPLRGEGVTITPLDTTNVETLYEIRFDGLRLDADQLVGTEGEAWPLLVSILTLERAGLGYHGRARRWFTALSQRLRLADERVAAQLRPRVAALGRRVAVGRELAWQAVHELVAYGADAATLPAATAKWFNTELGADIVDLAQEHEHESAGDDAATQVLDYARREALGLTLAAGTSEMMLSIVQANLRGVLAKSVADDGLSQSPLESTMILGENGEPPPDLGQIMLATLAPEREAPERTLLVAATELSGRSPLSLGPLEVTKSPGGSWSLSGVRWAQDRDSACGMADLLVPIHLENRGVVVALVDGRRTGVTLTER